MHKIITKQTFFRSLHRELILRGIWDRSAAKLMQDLREHITEERELQIANGWTPAEAESIALQQLGTPEEIAESAGQEKIRSGSWFHSSLVVRVLQGLFLGLLCWIGYLLMAAVPMGIYAFLNRHQAVLHVNADIAQYMAVLGPFLVAGTAIAFLSFHSQVAWRQLLASSISIAAGIAFLVPGVTLLSVLVIVRLYFPQYWNSNYIHTPDWKFGMTVLIQFVEFGALSAIPWIVRQWKLRQLSEREEIRA